MITATNKQQVAVCITAGIAGFKVCDLIKKLKAKGINVVVLMTDHARQMFATNMFAEVSGQPVLNFLFEKNFNYKKILVSRKVQHITLADQTDLVLVIPATANIIGKIANGVADDLISTFIMAAHSPVFIYPSMNTNMWTNPILQENLSKLQKHGYRVIPPDSGDLACGYKGKGRLGNIKQITEEILSFLNNKNRLSGKKILVTAGGTYEPIDAVRGITNRSSGKMGLAIALACQAYGARVLLLRSQTAVSCDNLEEKVFSSHVSLEKLIKENIPQFDVIFHTAAVSDYIPVKKLKGKYDSNKPLEVKLTASEKIVNKIRDWNSSIKLIAFKAVYRENEKDLIRRGVEKLNDSKADYVVVNDVGKPGIGFESDDNEIYVISPTMPVFKIEKSSKRQIANRLINYLYLD